MNYLGTLSNNLPGKKLCLKANVSNDFSIWNLSVINSYKVITVNIKKFSWLPGKNI